ncbi:hypothetical protein [Actinocrispum wychmicini]|nr:hypothetical protein [Actinocrispum wychmicini]
MDLRPRRVMHIGVGSGVTVSALAPLCDELWAGDPSADTIAALRSWLCRDPEVAGRVELKVYHAFSLDALPFEHFDTVVVNASALGLSNEHAVLCLLHAVMPKLADRGAVYFTGLGNPRLLAYRNAVSRGSAGVRVPPIDPAFFAGLRTDVRGLSAVDVRLPRGSLQNPLARDRYDAVLYKQPVEPLPLAQVPTLRWHREVIDLAGMAALLGGPAPDRVRVVGVPDRWLLGVARTGRSRAACGVDPLEAVHLGERLGYRVLVTWSSSAVDHKVDLLFLHRQSADGHEPVELYQPAGGAR